MQIIILFIHVLTYIMYTSLLLTKCMLCYLITSLLFILNSVHYTLKYNPQQSYILRIEMVFKNSP